MLAPAGDRDPGEIAMAIFVSGDRDADDEMTLGRAHGVVTLPEDADNPDRALQLAGQRLAADKRHQRESAKHQAHDALMAILNARRPQMGPHLRAVAFHAISVGRLLGLSREQLDDVVFAARLQHIGMLSVPDDVLESQSHLPAAESDLIRRPTGGRSARSSARPPRWPRSQPLSARPTRTTTAAATPTAWPATTSRSARASSPSASRTSC